MQQADRARALVLLRSTKAYEACAGNNGGGPARKSAKAHARALLSLLAGHPEAELIRDYLNAQREAGEVIQKQEVAGAVEYLQGLFEQQKQEKVKA